MLTLKVVKIKIPVCAFTSFRKFTLQYMHHKDPTTNR